MYVYDRSQLGALHSTWCAQASTIQVWVTYGTVHYGPRSGRRAPAWLALSPANVPTGRAWHEARMRKREHETDDCQRTRAASDVEYTEAMLMASRAEDVRRAAAAVQRRVKHKVQAAMSPLVKQVAQHERASERMTGQISRLKTDIKRVEESCGEWQDEARELRVELGESKRQDEARELHLMQRSRCV